MVQYQLLTATDLSLVLQAGNPKMARSSISKMAEASTHAFRHTMYEGPNPILCTQLTTI